MVRDHGEFHAVEVVELKLFKVKTRKCCTDKYFSSHNHGSVENGCISNMIVSFHLGSFSTEP